MPRPFTSSSPVKTNLMRKQYNHPTPTGTPEPKYRRAARWYHPTPYLRAKQSRKLLLDSGTSGISSTGEDQMHMPYIRNQSEGSRFHISAKERASKGIGWIVAVGSPPAFAALFDFSVLATHARSRTLNLVRVQVAVSRLTTRL